ncbi:MAG: hypothetical protein IT288_02885 [Bdellovibrionales bacterium]|nr:hypothetical protein [Bdellovibrionales bacterium]
MGLRNNVVTVIVMAGLTSFTFVGPVEAAEPATESPAAWANKMQESAKVLADGFPFLYSRREFRLNENKKRILSYLDRFKQSSHTLPVSEGEKFIGLDPLIGVFNTEIGEVLDTATKSYTEGDFDKAQSLVRSAVHKCFACHTAYQMGPLVQRMNVEVKGIPLEAMSKVEVLVALRQFVPALSIIEAKLSSGGTVEQLLPFLKMHLLISVRSLQDMARAQKAMGLFEKGLGKTKDHQVPLKAWSDDLAFWNSLKGTTAEKSTQLAQRGQTPAANASEGSYVLDLLKSYVLHQTLIDRKDQKALAKAYRDLGRAYQSLRAPILSDLPKIYFSACRKAAAGSEIAKDCQE